MMRALITKTLFVLSILLSAETLAFDVDGFSYTIINGTTVEVTGRALGNTDADIVIPATALDNTTTYSVTRIGPYAFENNALASVVIPNSVTTIGEGAFAFNALTSVTIPSSITTIGVSAFSKNALTSVVIPNSVTTIGEGAFANNALTSVTIGNSVTTIGDGAFFNNALTSVIIPDSVTTIGFGAFANNALTSVTIGNSVMTIGNYAFGFNNLTSVTIPDSVTSIGEQAFTGNALTSAAFLGNFGTFDLNMFEENPSLATITHCEGTTGWPQGFNNGSTVIVTIPIDCSPSPLAPDAPQITNIEPGNAQVSISVSVANDGGSPITDYTAYCFGDTFNFDASPTSPITISGLTNGVSYACAVTAANDAGTSPASAVSELVTPEATTAPDAPTIDSIAPGNGQATITFTPGADNGSPITNYEYSLDGVNYIALDPAVTVSPITITGLTNGTEYVMSLIAVNAAGESVASNSVSVTPGTSTAPDAPTIDSIAAGDGQVVITFTPGADNGLPITSYNAYCFGDRLLFSASPTSPIAVSGLTNRVSYTCAVTATNDIGDSPASAFSELVTPVAPPPGC